jgi:hypothetical protein
MSGQRKVLKQPCGARGQPFWGAAALVALLFLAVRVSLSAAAPQAQKPLQPVSHLPLVIQPFRCPTTSAVFYASGGANQFDLDNPVRPAALHADKNIALRGYVPNTDPGLRRDLVDYGSDDPNQPPQFATLFVPARVPRFQTAFRVYSWIWAPSPDPGYRGDPQTRYPVTALALETTPGEVLVVPSSDYDIGGGMEVLVLFADADTVALRYTREDSSGSPGYTVHIDNICTDPNLLALYRQLDRADGPRYVYVPPERRPYSYDLPALPAGKRIGLAGPGLPVISVSDTGSFQDPRSCNDWWQIRPGYGTGCSRN